MTPEEYIADILSRRNALELRLRLVEASDIPPRLKQHRIRLVQREIDDLKAEVRSATAALRDANGNRP